MVYAIVNGPFARYYIGKYILYNKTLRGKRTRLIGSTLGAASLQVDSLFLEVHYNREEEELLCLLQ